MMTHHKRLMRMDSGSTLNTFVDIWKCDWVVHNKNFPTWKDAIEAILAGPQGEWPKGFLIFNDRMVRGVICVPTPLQELLIHDHHSFWAMLGF